MNVLRFFQLASALSWVNRSTYKKINIVKIWFTQIVLSLIVSAYLKVYPIKLPKGWENNMKIVFYVLVKFDNIRKLSPSSFDDKFKYWITSPNNSLIE